MALAGAACLSGPAGAAAAAPAMLAPIASVQPKLVKIYGAGGFRGLEAYQSGMLISAEGHVLTAFSYVLDSDAITVVLSDGRRFSARLLGADPRIEVALLTIDAQSLPHFDLTAAAEVPAGTRILALSNLFGVAAGNEPLSVQQGIVSVQTQLAGYRGVFETPYQGPVYVLDAVTNNPGAAGGAVVTRDGRLVGMLGKQLRNALSGTWLNYAIPIGELRYSVDEILAGRLVVPDSRDDASPADPLSPDALGVVFVPEVLERTPPFVDLVRPGSAAARAGLAPDDLVVLLDDRLIQSVRSLRTELARIERIDPVRLTVLRRGELLELTLFADPTREPRP